MPSMWLATKTPRFSVTWSSSTSMLAICSKPVKRSLGLFQNPLASNDDTSRSVRNNHWWRTQEKKPRVSCCVLLLWPQQKGTVNCMTALFMMSMPMPLLHGDRFYSPEFLLVARHQKAQSSFSCWSAWRGLQSMARNLPADRSHFGDVCGTRYHLMRER